MTDDRTVKAVLAELKKAVGAKGKVVIDAYNYDADHAVNVDSISSKRADELEAVCKALGVMLVGQDGSNREASELADKIVLQIEGLLTARTAAKNTGSSWVPHLLFRAFSVGKELIPACNPWEATVKDPCGCARTVGTRTRPTRTTV